MATKEGDVRVQVPLTYELAEQMEQLAVELRKYLDEKPKRAMQRGPMISLVARWFYGLPRGVQGTILNAGAVLTKEDEENGVPDFREAEAEYLKGLSYPEWLTGSKKPPKKPKG